VFQPEKTPNAGLLFMCVNADIERQFEFLQQTWILGPNFHDLDDEIDPVVGYRGPGDTMSIPTPRGPLRLQGLAKFVTTRGGGYFFLPSRSALERLATEP
jgi:deferrochelatase/peroxidase EfeB